MHIPLCEVLVHFLKSAKNTNFRESSTMRLRRKTAKYFFTLEIFAQGERAAGFYLLYLTYFLMYAGDVEHAGIFKKFLYSSFYSDLYIFSVTKGKKERKYKKRYNPMYGDYPQAIKRG